MFTQFYCDPFPTNSVFEELNRELDQWFKQGLPRKTIRFPKVQLGETKEDYRLYVFVPGIEKEQIDLVLEKNALTIRSKESEKIEAGKFLKKERSSKNFSRIINLPAKADSEKIEASFQDGVLSIIIGKQPEPQPKQIQIKVDEQ